MHKDVKHITPLIKVRDIAWVRLRSPDLDSQEAFFTDFGLVRTERTRSKLFMRGTGSARHIAIAEYGETAFLSLGFWADSLEALETLAAEADGASQVESIDEPGGGHRVTLTDPYGLRYEIVHGVAPVEPLPVRRIALNDAVHQPRLQELARIDPQPSHVKRLGHAVLNTTDVLKSVAWARRHLGVVSSDDVHDEEDPGKTIASFNRADRGADYVDHHMLLYVNHARVGLNHLGFEADGLEDLLAGQDYLLKQAKYRHVWGVGRHFLGSQIFDYWKDPYGRQCEHWTDSDLLNNEHLWRRFPRKLGLRSQWGAPSPDEFRESSS